MDHSRDGAGARGSERASGDRDEVFRFIVEQHPSPACLVDLESGDIIYESPAARALVAAPDRGQRIARAVDYYPERDLRKRFVDTLRARGELHGFEMQTVRADGREVLLGFNARLLERNGRQVALCAIEDLTEKRAASERARRQRERLEQVEKMSALGELLAGIAHELNNPLTVVLGQSLILEEMVVDPDVARRVGKIAEAAGRCTRIVKTFLAMARREPSEPREVDLDEIVSRVLQVCDGTLRAAGVHVRRRCARRLPPVLGDPSQLEQVVSNLVINAQQALQGTDGARELTLATASDPVAGEVVLEVEDTGPGVPGTVRSRIFEPFFTTKDAGTGIGLALCHRIVRSHGGTIELAPSRDGARFVIRLPAARLAHRDDAAGERTAAREATSRVLVVDDDADVAGTVAAMLGGAGHEVEVAHSARAALRALDARAFAAVVCDFRMPHMNGEGFYRALCASHPHMRERLAFLSGDTLSAGARSFLSRIRAPVLDKPATPAELRDVVQSLAAADGSPDQSLGRQAASPTRAA